VSPQKAVKRIGACASNFPSFLREESTLSESLQVIVAVSLRLQIILAYHSGAAAGAYCRADQVIEADRLL
jgi:hypothetical protein